jgi:hypothetical protein
MGYLGYCYVDSKSFEFRSEVSGGVRLAERSRRLFRAVIFGWSSLVWLMQAVERLSKGEEDNDKWRTFLMGSTVYMVLRRKNKHGLFIELSEYGRGGRRSYVVIPKGSDGKGWMDVWVQLQKLTNYHAKQQAGGTDVGRKTVTAPKEALRVLGLRQEGQSYAAVLGGQLPKGGGVPADGRGSKVIRKEPEKEESLIVAGDHAEGRGVTISNWPAGSIRGNGLKQNLDEVKNLDELKTFLWHFKEEAERWLGLLELGCGNEKLGSGGLEDGGQGNKVHSEHFKPKDPIITDKRDGELMCVYSRRSPCKVTTQWQQVSRQPMTPAPQPDRAMLSEKAGFSPGDEKDRFVGMRLLVGSCSTGLPELCTETEHVSQQSLALKLQPDRAAWIELEVVAPGKVGLVGELVAGSSLPAGQETHCFRV